MKRFLLFLFALSFNISLMAAYETESKGNRLWLTFDSETTIAFDLTRSGKDKDHENFIDRGEGVADYGWYNLETGESGSFANGTSATFNAGDQIGLYVKDNDGNTFTSTKDTGEAELGEDVSWGKSDEVDDGIALYGGNKGSNGTHEYYVFKVSNSTAGQTQAPSGQPLPGIIATLIVGGGAVVYLKKRKKASAEK